MPAPWIPHDVAVAAKLAIAAATAGWILVDQWLRRRGRASWRRRTRDAILAGLGLAGVSGWWWFGAAPVWNDLHPHDTFHYFMGARYFPELGYRHLYLCTLGADLEAGVDLGPRVRDLASNDLATTDSLLDAARACRWRLTPERWESFRADVGWFRARLAPREWHQILEDHGFNGTPIWLLGGALLAQAPGGPAALPWLVRADLPLLAILWAGVIWGFGWRTAAVAAVFWGTNGLEGSDWSGGTLLRQDWLVALVLGIACLRREKPFAAGVLLATATGLRAFPALVVAGVVGRRVLAALAARSLATLRPLARFVAGAAVASALLAALATAAAGPDAWRGFAANSEKLLATPLFNQVGLRPLLAFAPGATARALEEPDAVEPNRVWKAQQRERWERRRGFAMAVGAAYLLLLAFALRRQEDWSAAALSTGAIPVFTALTGYYHVALLGLALLVARDPWAGVAALGLAAGSQLLYAALPYSDVPFVAISALELAVVFLVTALATRELRPARGVG